MKEYPYIHGKPELLTKMQQTSVLDPFNDEHLMGILSMSRIREYADGETIIDEGSFDMWIYMLLSGEVRVVKRGTDICDLTHVGDLFGEMAVITGSPRSANVYAVGDTKCLALDASYMNSLSGSDKLLFVSALFRIFVELLTKRLKISNERFVEAKMAHPDVK